MSLQQDRRRFNTQTAPVLAERVGVPGLWNGHGSERFAYFCDDQRLVIVARPAGGQSCRPRLRARAGASR